MRKLYASYILIAVLIISFYSCGSSSFDPDLIPVKIGSKWGYVDFDGKYIINPQFKYANYFIDELALVKNNNDLFGFIDDNGNYMIKPQYKRALSFSEDMACIVKENDFIRYINKKGNIKLGLPNAIEAGGFHNGLAKVKFDSGWGFINKEGETVINPVFLDVKDFTEGLAAVKMKIEGGEELWGYVDKEGEIVINPQFKNTQAFNEGLAASSIDDVDWGFIDKKGKFVINPQFKKVSSFSNGLAIIEIGRQYGIINKEGDITINPQFDNIIFPPSHDMIAIEQGYKFGYIDMKGQYIINPQFDMASCYLSDIAIIQKGHKIGFIDKDGRYRVNPQFNDVAPMIDYCQFGPGYSFESIKTDYFNMKLFLNKLFFDNKFIWIDTSVVLGDVLRIFNIDSTFIDKYGIALYTNKVLDKKVNINDASIRELDFYFKDKPYKSIANYEFYTDFWGNKQKRIINYSKLINRDAKIKKLKAKIVLRNNGKGKAGVLTEELIEAFMKAYNMKNKVIGDGSVYKLFSDDGKVYVYIKHFNSTINLTVNFDRKSNLEKINKIKK